LHLWADGLEEFKHGFREINKGNEYISPAIQKVMDVFSEWPRIKDHVTNRQMECVVLLCGGFDADCIASELNVTRKTIDKALGAMFDVFHVHSKEELISQAWVSGLVKEHDLRFYRKDTDLKLPDWAVVSQTANEKLEKFYYMVHGGNE
jgi:DNA-binding CsgD family transcriptional regulator